MMATTTNSSTRVNPINASVRFDFEPAVSREQLEQHWLAAAKQHGTRKVASVLPRRCRRCTVTASNAGSVPPLACWR